MPTPFFSRADSWLLLTERQAVNNIAAVLQADDCPVQNKPHTVFLFQGCEATTILMSAVFNTGLPCFHVS